MSTGLVNRVMSGAVYRAGWLAFDKTVSPAFSDFALTVLDQIAEGDEVTTRFRLGGTHTGEFCGISASGNTAFLTGPSVDRMESGTVVEHWGDLYFTGFLQELPAPGVSRTGEVHRRACVDAEVEADRSSCQRDFGGTRAGEFFSIPASGKHRHVEMTNGCWRPSRTA
jgi:predicted ester cyclase